MNVSDEQQRSEFGALAVQLELPLIFYDETLSARLSKRVRMGAGAAVAEVLRRATRLVAKIDPDQLDFDRAKVDVMAATRL